MKAPSIGLSAVARLAWSIAAVIVLQAGPCPAAPAVMKEASTHDQLVLKLRKSQQEDPMQRMPVSQGKDPSQNLPKDLISQSDIICFAGLATLVPKRAVMQIPEDFTSRMKFEPGSKIVGWADFYVANRGWITTVEITRVQAEGNQPIAEDTRKLLAKSRNLVVATYQGGPISLLPLKAPPPAKPPLSANPAENATEISQP